MTATIADHPDTGAKARQRENLRSLFDARSIALIGASADPTKLGSAPIASMATLNFQGTINVVNPRYEELAGHRCYPSVDALPDDVDAAMIILPAPAAVETAEALVARGIQSIVMIPQGFGEAGGEGVERDKRLLALADQGAAITGPNTNGMANVATGLAMSIAPIWQYPGRVLPGRIGVISQSGAMVSSLITYVTRCGLGVGKSITCGNELILGAADYLDFMAEDSDTDIIIIYLETIRDVPAFRAALANARTRGKPVIAIKVGESDSGQKATLSHTGAIAGSYRNIIAFLENEGVYVADDLESLAMIAECLTRYEWSPDDAPAKPFIASISGGFAAQTADVMARLGMPLQDPSEAGAAALSALPTQAHPVNPYDIAAQNPLIPRIIEIFREDGFNQLLFGFVMLKPEINAQVSQMLIDAKTAGMTRLFALSPQVDSEDRARFNAAGILITDNAVALLKALRAIETHRRNAQARAARTAAPRVVPDVALPSSAGLVDEARSKALIEQAGIRTPRNRVLRVADGLADLSGLTRPLVMKGLSDKIAHKSEYGLVALGLSKDEEIGEAWGCISAALAKADPDADSILVEEMIGSGLEAILGVQRDSTVGPVVVLGAGGILVELLDDAVILVPPFTPADAKAAMARTKFGKLLNGYRGRHFDAAALADAAATLGDIALANPRLESLDVNPVLVQPQGQGVIAVDAKIVIGD